MMTKLLSKSRALLLTLVVGLICSPSAFGSATVTIVPNDAPGVGFNDPTPVAPVGGNTGTTLGQQRLNAFQFAANIWGATVTSGPTIKVSASWAALDCTANSAVLGSAGTINLHRNFTNAPFANTWYPTALANALSGIDLNAGTAEISASFNINVGTPGCLENKPWYYGLDTNHTSQRVNLVTVVLHELGHGLGFSSFTNEENGKLFVGTNGVAAPSVYDRFLLDDTTGKTWTQMTDAERVASAINNHNLVWNGPQVVADADFLTAGKDSSGRPQLFAPSPLQGGSSVSHWDTTAAPNQLMEPFISTNLSFSPTTPQDLTFSLLKDIGWCASCPVTTTPPPGPPPANDNFASAQTISGCSGSISANNNNATRETGEPGHNPDPAEDPGGASVWYQWQAPSTGVVTINLASTEDAPHDTMLGVYTGNSVGALTAVAKNDDIVTGTQTNSRVQFTATAGTVYKIAAAGWGGAQGNFTLSWTENGCTAAKLDQTISFSSLADKTTGDAPFTVSATASSGLPVSFSVFSGPATISGSTVTITGAGVVTIRASQAGNATYNAAPPVDRSFTVTTAKLNQTITFNSLPDKTYGDVTFDVSATSTSGLAVSFSVSGPATISGKTITLTGAGTVTVTASQAGNATYNAATPVSQIFTVNKATPVIVWNNPADITYGTALGSIQLNATVLETGTFTYTPAAGTILNAGANQSLTVNFTPSNFINYNSVSKTVAINVLKANQTISFNLIPNKTFGDAPFSLSATSTSGLPVTFQVISGPAFISGSTATLTGAGDVTIRATQAGNTNYNAAAAVDRTFNVASSGIIPTVTLLMEEDNIHAIAVDSVTLMRGPFSIFNLLNFSADQHTRVTIFTSNLGAVLPGELSVHAGGVQLPIESVGTVRGLDASSYIVVRLVDGLPVGDLSLTVTLRGVPSNAGLLSIAP